MNRSCHCYHARVRLDLVALAESHGVPALRRSMKNLTVVFHQLEQVDMLSTSALQPGHLDKCDSDMAKVSLNAISFLR
jgi:hypothetical protein